MDKGQKSVIPHPGKITEHFDISTFRILVSMLAHVIPFLLFKNILFINQLLVILKIQLTISCNFKNHAVILDNIRLFGEINFTLVDISCAENFVHV